jgi:hypothetical protein
MDFIFVIFVSTFLVELWMLLLGKHQLSVKESLIIKTEIIVTMLLVYFFYIFLTKGYSKQLFIDCLAILCGGALALILTSLKNKISKYKELHNL